MLKKLENMDPKTGSIFVADFIASPNGLNQGSYNTELGNRILALAVGDTLEKKLLWLRGRSGEEAANIIANIKSFTANKVKTLGEDGAFMSKYDSYTKVNKISEALINARDQMAFGGQASENSVQSKGAVKTFQEGSSKPGTK
jgi:hypothetical protein